MINKFLLKTFRITSSLKFASPLNLWGVSYQFILIPKLFVNLTILQIQSILFFWRQSLGVVIGSDYLDDIILDDHWCVHLSVNIQMVREFTLHIVDACHI